VPPRVGYRVAFFAAFAFFVALAVVADLAFGFLVFFALTALAFFVLAIFVLIFGFSPKMRFQLSR